MPAYRNRLNRALTAAAPLVTTYTALAMFFLFLYRVKIFGLMGEIYPELSSLSFFAVCRLAAPADAAALTAIIAALILAALSLSAFPRARVIAPALILLALMSFLLMAAEFFRIYETTFQTDFVGREHFSDISDLIRSSAAEFSGWFPVLFIIGLLLIAGLTILLLRRQDNEARRTVHETVRWVAPVILAVCILTMILGSDETHYEKRAAELGSPPSKKHIAALREIAQNPLANLWYFPLPATPALNATPAASKAERFSFRFNTDSLIDNRRHARSTIIARGKRYNIILYFFESFPSNYLPLKIQGREVTPVWHRLKANSLFLTNHYANYPLSANALFSVLTGAYEMSSKNMVITRHPSIPLKILPEYLKQEGYRTALMHTGGLGYAGQDRFLRDRSIDRIIEYRHLKNRPPYNRQVGWGIDERAMIAPAKEFIKADRTRPFMLVMMPVNPHHPYAYPEDATLIAGGDDPDFRTRNWNNYLNSLHYADDSLGKLVDELEAEGLMDNTLLFLFADHGEAFYQHRQNYNHPLFLYEENVHVPFLVYNRALFPRPITLDRVTRHIDILPTILDVLGVAAAPEVEGVSLLSAHHEQMAILHTSWKDDMMGIRDGRWKYLVRLKDRGEELYDLTADPDERNNVAGSHDAIVRRYRDVTQKAYRYKVRFFSEVLNRQ